MSFAAHLLDGFGMMRQGIMSRYLGLFTCLLLVSGPGPGTAASARAEEAHSPLVEMRAAAEERADLDPDAERGAAIRDVRRSAPVSPLRGGLREAVRAAVRSEVEREVSGGERAAPGGVNRGARGDGKDNADRSERGPIQGSGSDVRGASEQARSAAIAAQEARRNSDVAKERGRGNNGNGKPGKP
jgi:hypothetical protein